MSFMVALVVWAQVAAPAPQQAEAAAAPTELSLEAGVLLRNGDVKRVARTPVMLLNADFGEKVSAGLLEGCAQCSGAVCSLSGEEELRRDGA